MNILFFCSFNHRNEYHAPGSTMMWTFLPQLLVERKMVSGFRRFRLIRVEGVLASIELLASGSFCFVNLFRQYQKSNV